MKQETYQKLRDGMPYLRRAERQLNELASALSFVGNPQLSQRLYEIAATVNEAQCLIDDGIGDACRDGLQEVGPSTANMMNATLAGIQLARMEPASE